MQAVKIPRVKICCMGSVEEAKIAIEAGADAVGLVSAMPSGPGVIEDNLIKEISKTVPPPIATFLLTSKTDTDSILTQVRDSGINTVQLVDKVQEEVLKELKHSLPGVKIVQVVHVVDEHSTEEAVNVEKLVDAVLLDSGNPNLGIKELGGTGRVHNWEISRRIRERLRIPVFLAGGLNPGNVKIAIETVGPFGVDVCSGVRTNGMLDKVKLAEFFKAAGYNR